jgi:predicted RNase H-like nuclease
MSWNEKMNGQKSRRATEFLSLTRSNGMEDASTISRTKQGGKNAISKRFSHALFCHQRAIISKNKINASQTRMPLELYICIDNIINLSRKKNLFGC